MKNIVYALAALLIATLSALANAQNNPAALTPKKFSDFLAKGFPEATPCGTTEFILILQNGQLRALPCSPLVRGPDGATQNNIAVFSGIDGKTLKDGGRALPSGNIVGTTDTQTLTGKTMDYNNNTFLNFPNGGGGGVTPNGANGNILTGDGANGFGTPIVLGAGMAALLSIPSSANFAAAVTGETGSGALVFGTSPTLITPNLGTPSAISLPNATNIPAGALTGTVSVTHGGTGVTALTGHGVVTMNTGGTAQTTVAPGANNNCLVSNGTDWGSAACPGGGGGATPNGSANDILTSNGASNFGTPITPGTGVAAFLGTPIAGIPATWLQAGAAVANLGFTPPPNTRSVATSGLLTGGGNLTADRTITMASIAANSVVANATGSSAVPTAVAVPACADSGGNHLNYASGVFSCGTSSSGGGGSAPGTPDGSLQYRVNSTTFGGATLGSGLDMTGGTLSLVMVPNSQSGASYTVLSTDANKTLRMTNASATTVNLTAAATLGANFGFYQECDAGCTIDPAGAETINGASTLVLAAHQKAEVSTDGTVWRAGILPALDPSNASNLASGTVPAARGGAGTVSGVMKANGSGGVSAAAAGTDYLAPNGTVDCTVATCSNFPRNETFGWIAGADIATYPSVIYTAIATTTVLSIRGRVANPLGSAGTVTIYKAPSGTACGSGTAQATGSFDANGTAATNQTLTLVGGAANVLASGDSLCAVASGTFSSGAAAGTLTFKLQVL